MESILSSYSFYPWKFFLCIPPSFLIYLPEWKVVQAPLIGSTLIAQVSALNDCGPFKSSAAFELYPTLSFFSEKSHTEGNIMRGIDHPKINSSWNNTEYIEFSPFYISLPYGSFFLPKYFSVQIKGTLPFKNAFLSIISWWVTCRDVHSYIFFFNWSHLPFRCYSPLISWVHNSFSKHANF